MLYVLGSDHAGLNLAEFVKSWLLSAGLEILDFLPSRDAKVDYPDFAQRTCKKVLESPQNRGILICGSGLGMSISANRYRGIRAALCTDAYMAKMARMHNDANVLCMGERVSGIGVAASILEAFSQTDFEGGRHQCRIAKIEDFDMGMIK